MLQETLDSAILYVLKRDPIDTRRTVVFLGQRVGFLKRFQLAYVNI